MGGLILEKRRYRLILAMVVGLCANLASGCLMHDSACYQRCMSRHRQCITRSQSSAALEGCDAHMAHCRKGCTW